MPTQNLTDNFCSIPGLLGLTFERTCQRSAVKRAEP